MNKKGGVGSTVTMVWALIVWTLLIIAFWMLFQVTAEVHDKNPGEIEKNSSLVGKLHPKVQEKEIMLAYLNTPIETCSFAQKQNMTYDLTYAEMIHLFMRGGPIKNINSEFGGDKQKSDYSGLYSNLGDSWDNTSYVGYMKVWDVCTESYIHEKDSGYLYQLGDSNKELIFSKKTKHGKSKTQNDFSKNTASISIQTTQGMVYFTLTRSENEVKLIN